MKRVRGNTKSKLLYWVDGLEGIAFTAPIFIFMVFRRPIWLSLKVAVILTTFVVAISFCCVMLTSFAGERNSRSIIVNLVIAYGIATLFLYADLYTTLVVVGIIVTLLGIIFSEVLEDIEKCVSEDRISIGSRIKAGMLLLSVVALLLVGYHRIEIINEIWAQEHENTTEERNKQEDEPIKIKWDIDYGEVYAVVGDKRFLEI